MATSGTTSYSVTELDVITAALSKLGVTENGQTLDADDVVVCRRNLNMILKQWVAQADFAPGLKMWTRRRGWLFMQDGQVEYDLGPTGDECAAETYLRTTVAEVTAGGASFVRVASDDGMSSGMRIGFLLNTGSMHWTTINGVPSSDLIPIADVLPSAVAIGNVVYSYTSKVHRPFEIISASMRDSDGIDTPMDPHMSLEEYECIPSKTGEGTPARLYFEAKRTNSVAYLDCAPDDLTRVVRLVYYSYIEDSTAVGNDVDLPAEWFKALVGQTAIDSAPDFSRPVTPELKLYRDDGLTMARNAYPATSEAYYQSEPDAY